MTGRAVRGGSGCWFQPADVDPDARARVFLFPCAGGNAQMYREWPGLFPPGLAVQAVQLPGRLDRRAERPHTEMASLINAMTEAFAAELDGRPYAFFGHSMGALIAYRVAMALEKESVGGPVLIGAAGWAPEGFVVPTREKLGLADSAMVDWIASLGSLPEAIYRDPEMLALTIPPTRADLTLYINYADDGDDGAPISCPVATYTGKSDPLMASGAMTSWGGRSAAHLGNCEFPGGHFFIYQEAQAIAADLARHIERVSAASGRLSRALPGA